MTIINNFMYNKNYGNASISGKNNLEETASWINRCAEIECVGRTGENLKVEVSKIDEKGRVDLKLIKKL